MYFERVNWFPPTFTNGDLRGISPLATGLVTKNTLSYLLLTMSPARTLEKGEHEVSGIRTHDTPLVS